MRYMVVKCIIICIWVEMTLLFFQSVVEESGELAMTLKGDVAC